MSLPMYCNKKPGVDRVSSIIAIASGKGGVGKSTLSCCLALACKAKGLKVGLLDSDLYGPSAHRMLPPDQLPKKSKEGIHPAICRGVKVASAGFLREENCSNAVRAPIANRLLNHLIHEHFWEDLDLLFLDLPPGTGDIQITLSQTLPLTGALLVTLPQEVALADVRKASHMLCQVEVPILGVVENMSGLFGQGGGRRFAEEIGARHLADLPFDKGLVTCMDRGISPFTSPLVEATTLRLLQQIANDLLQEIERHSTKPINHAVRLLNPTTVEIPLPNQQPLTCKATTLQKHCPCAECSQRKGKVDEAVQIRAIKPVGRYGVNFLFDRGCSHGLFHVQDLQQIASAPR